MTSATAAADRREREHGAAWVPEPQRLPPRRVTGTFLAVAAVATLLASILTVHGWANPVVIAGGAALAAAPFTRRFLCRYGGPQLAQSYAVASIYLVLLSTLVLRRRSTAELAATPLDSAGLYRVACLAAAAGLAVIAIVLTRRWEGVPRIPRPAMLTLAYIGAAVVPIVIAVSPGLASFRVLELVIFFTVFLACHRSFRGTWDVPIRHLMDVIYALLATAFIGAVRYHDEAFGEIHGSDRLKGVFPQLSADFIGILGSLCVAYGLGHRRVRWLPVVFGTAFVIVAQHRTGLVAVAVVVIVRLLYQKRTSLTLVGMTRRRRTGHRRLHGRGRQPLAPGPGARGARDAQHPDGVVECGHRGRRPVPGDRPRSVVREPVRGLRATRSVRDPAPPRDLAGDPRRDRSRGPRDPHVRLWAGGGRRGSVGAATSCSSCRSSSSSRSA